MFTCRQKSLLNNVQKEGLIELTNDEKEIYDNLDRDGNFLSYYY